MSRLLRAAIYLRVSTIDQNTELQKAELLQYLSNRGLNLVASFEDKASGTNDSRAQFQAMLISAKRREFDVLVVWKLDRFGRSLRDIVVHLNDLHECGVIFVSVKDQIDLGTATGRLMLHLLGSFAEFEASLIKERVKAGIANARRKGIKLGRPRTTDPQLIKNLRAEGYTYSAIARRLGVSKALVHKTLKDSVVTKPFTNIEINGSGDSVRKE